MTLSSIINFRRIDDIETHIEDLIHQKNMLQSIEKYSDRIDFGDLIETYSLLNDEIERLQKQFRDEKQKSFEKNPGERGEGIGGDKTPPSSPYEIEQVIMGSDGKLRPVMPEDVNVEKNKGIMEAFRIIYGSRSKEAKQDRD